MTYRNDIMMTPEDIEKDALTIASWIRYNGRPFVFTTDDNRKAFLVLVSEEEMQILEAAAKALAEPPPKKEEK